MEVTGVKNIEVDPESEESDFNHEAWLIREVVGASFTSNSALAGKTKLLRLTLFARTCAGHGLEWTWQADA